MWFLLDSSVSRLKRAFLLGPLREDHPNFTSSNPERASYLRDAIADLSSGTPTLINPATGLWTGGLTGTQLYWEAGGPWDVDSDGDGVPDSIWVDLGLPVRQTADGRKYKPLFAILCTDLDGRLNLNAHGCSEQLRAEYYTNGNTQEGAAFIYYGGADGIRSGGPSEADAVLEGDQDEAYFGYYFQSAGDVNGVDPAP